MWNLLSRLVNNGAIKHEEYPTWEAARYAQERLIKDKSPIWTAVVKNRRI